MQILEVAEGVILSRPDSFNMNQIITSGQCFRWDEIKTNVWKGVAFDTLLEIELLDDNSYLFKCTKEAFYSLWYDYFDFERDYEQIKRSVSGDSFLEKAVVVGDGIRILRQDPFEMLITFIISQCSNIPKIKTNVNILCQKLGAYVEDKHGKDGYYLFPTPKALAENPIDINSAPGNNPRSSSTWCLHASITADIQYRIAYDGFVRPGSSSTDLYGFLHQHVP